MEERYCIIMAGGIGSRFWPLSKNNYPKQFIDIFGTGKSFIRSTFERFLPVVKKENFVVVTNRQYRDTVLEHIPELEESQILCEPMRRNTAPCIAYASEHIKAVSGSENVAVIVAPSDHLITNERRFQEMIEAGSEYVCKEEDALLTIGIKPTRAETGYGYIELPEKEYTTGIYKVHGFKEKPNKELAKQYLESGKYLWNSGIFIWSLSGIMDAMNKYIPELMAVMREGEGKYGTVEEQKFIDENFHRCPNISIDYGVMEKSEKCYTMPGEIGWSDIGTWGSFYTHKRKDESGNAVCGKVVTENVKGSIIHIEEGTEAIIEGLEDYLVAYRDHSLLICRMSEEQRIKEWVEKL